MSDQLRVLPIHMVEPFENKESALNVGEEFESLIATLGGKIVDRVIQSLSRSNNITYIGRGKVTEVAEKIKQHDVDVVILNAMVKPRQIHALKEKLRTAKFTIDVWDRVDLILHIFDKHAQTQEAKLQIELARMNYMGPRIYGMGFVMSRQGGGIGTLGVGETNTELMKRHWRDEKKKIIDQLEKIRKNKQLQLERRKRAGFKTVSLVGYTNAGKSSLFNLLTGKEKIAKNVLFATLDSSVGKIYVEDLHTEVLITDTIGFIRALPPLLISAFKSTLMESLNADILLHVIDISDHEVETKIQVVMDILQELGRDPKDIIFVFNKTDAVSNLDKKTFVEKYASYSPLFISVKNGQGIGEVKTLITNNM